MNKSVVFAVFFPLAAAASGPQVTVYNDGFAVVKENRSLYVRDGVSEIRVTDMTRQLEPDSVILRELGEQPFGIRILEQSFVNDPLTEGLMLHQLEGQSVRFEEKRENGTVLETEAKVIRSGYVPGRGLAEEPIVEQDGEVRFTLPGRPVFKGLDPASFLKPSLVWQIASARQGECPVEISYITEGMRWEATYSLVAPAEGADEYAMSGWISLENNTGKTFEEADVKLIAGDVARVRRPRPVPRAVMADSFGLAESAMPEQRAFDEFHLYTLPRPVMLRNNELKQVEFIRASGIRGRRSYTYAPAIHYRYGGGFIQDPNFGMIDDNKVNVRIDISNSETNGLGVPLPKGRMRLYRTDDVDGRREFTGENNIDHLPKNETLKLDMGRAFDLVGERKRTDFKVDSTARRLAETFEIRLRNRKDTPVVIEVIERLYRGANWKITSSSQPHEKTDADTIRFTVPVDADGETVVTYSAAYSW